ncbi:hypothetical protein EV714DRAFT_268285 [Schizophyllum commune]
MAMFKDVDWMLVPTEETMKKIEEICEHNDYADGASRKMFSQALSQPTYKYELLLLGFTLEHRRATLYATFDDAHHFFVVMQAYFYACHLAPCGTSTFMREAADAILRVTAYWRDAPPVKFWYGPQIASEHRHPGSIAAFIERERKRRKAKRPSDKVQTGDTKKTARAKEGVRKPRLRAFYPPGTARSTDEQQASQSGSSLGKRKRGSDAAADGSPGASSSQLSSHAPGTLPADVLHTNEAIRNWMRKMDLSVGDEGYTAPETPPELAAVLALSEITSALVQCEATSALAQCEATSSLAQYDGELSRDPEEVLRSNQAIQKRFPTLWQKPDTSRYCSNDWAYAKCRTHLWAPCDSQSI